MTWKFKELSAFGLKLLARQNTFSLVLTTAHLTFLLYTTLQHSLIEDPINLAVDSGIPNIIIMGDFNIKMLNSTASRKLISLSQQLYLTQLISEPTHFTESSNSLIDIILTSNPLFIYTVGVGDPCLDQPVRYHCSFLA
jgi:hypothetical protein